MNDKQFEQAIDNMKSNAGMLDDTQFLLLAILKHLEIMNDKLEAVELNTEEISKNTWS